MMAILGFLVWICNTEVVRRDKGLYDKELFVYP
jgi:hypothetical protein